MLRTAKRISDSYGFPLRNIPPCVCFPSRVELCAVSVAICSSSYRGLFWLFSRGTPLGRPIRLLRCEPVSKTLPPIAGSWSVGGTPTRVASANHLYGNQSQVVVLSDQREVFKPQSNSGSAEEQHSAATIDLPASWSGSRVVLDFGPGSTVKPPENGFPHFEALLESPVREAAQVFINGQANGSIWKPPYELDVTSAIHAGQNHLKIIVYNLAINALAGRARPGYRLLNSRYGERFKPQDMEEIQPLPSGLLATPRLAVRKAE